MNNPNRLIVSNDQFDEAVKATTFVRKHRIRAIEERLHDLTSLKLMPKKWENGSNISAQEDSQDKIKSIPVRIIRFEVADIMVAMNYDNEFQFWAHVLFFLHKNVFENPWELFNESHRDLSEEQLQQIRKKIIRNYNQEVAGIDDLLGVFFPCKIKHHTTVLQPWIELYPQVIAYFSFLLGVSVESLATVVLTHELAHAYTLAGYDINGSRGNLLCTYLPEDMAEGIAQYYTNAVCEQLEQQYNGIKMAFSELLAKQRTPYKVFQKWKRNGSFDHEAVRSVWIKYRDIPLNYSDEQALKNDIQNYNQKPKSKSLWP
ncbi:MAG: hypothetical protein RBS43_01920 [Candidatus Cloacimonas sp.]|jgi:hypothetical protein|nr:hypothetical protein [Candidatus Cloacimonas sp.]